jgi:hypothetical protein
MMHHKRRAIGVVLAAWCLLTRDVYGAAYTPGDVFVNMFVSSMPIQRYRADGTFVRSYGTTGTAWEGATISRDGILATTRRLPISGVSLFDAATGDETRFDTPHVVVPADVSFFADGTLAVSDQGGDVDLYSRIGVHLGTISHLSLSGLPFGNAVGLDDTLWVATFEGGVAHFARDGTFLGSFTPFSVADLAVDSVDGTLWIPDRSGVVHHYTSSGIELGMFPTAVIGRQAGQHMSIAAAIDQTLYITSTLSDAVYHYTPQGVFLDAISLPTEGRPLFMSVAIVPEPSGMLLTWMIAVAIGSRLTRRYG